MLLETAVFSKVLESNVVISLGIAGGAVIIIVVFIFFFFHRRLYLNTSEDSYSLPHTTKKIAEQSSLENQNIEVWGPLQTTHFPVQEQENHIRIDVQTQTNPEPECGEVGASVASKLLRNRGSCSSSGDSTEEDPRRTRFEGRYARTFSQDDQMPLATQREDLEDQYSDIHSAFSDSMSGIIGKCGLLEVAFAYDAPVKKMTIHVLQARDIPATDRGRPPYTQVHIVLLPGKKQKQKSKIRLGDNPQYMESFLFNRITPEDVNNMSVRFRLYGCERMRRRLIGECIISFSNVNLQLQSNIWVPLEPRANTAINASACEVLSLCQSDSTGSMQSMQHGGVPELLLGLSYNGTTGRLSVEIIKGSNFRHVTATKAPDTYIKLMLISSTGQEMARSKTTIRRAQPNPLFKETFMYQVALFQLGDVTLMIIVYNKKTIRRKERIGWFTMGRTSSGDEELAHWEEMKNHKGDQLARWHVLVET